MQNRTTLICFFLFTAIHVSDAQNIGIGTTTPHASARLEISGGINTGLLIPRMPTPIIYGGDGGGGAGTISGIGGASGGTIVYTSVIGIPVCQFQSQNATVGDTGTSTTAGVGGSGGLTGIAGANGGIRAQAGQNTVNTFGGAGGKSITGGSGNSIVNISGGQNFGTID